MTPASAAPSPPPAAPTLSVCIVTGRRIPMLDACLVSLLDQRDPPAFEVLVCSDGDPDVAAAVHRRFPEAQVCAVARALPGAARNLLVQRARGDVLVFLDDDIVADRDLLATYARLAAAHPAFGVFGGPNATPPGSNRFQVVQGEVLASAAGAGPVRRRYGGQPAGEADETAFILCNMAVRREVMAPFSTDLVCAEENLLLEELRRRGVRMYHDPGLVVHHERRPTPRGFAQQVRKYGRGRGQLLARHPGATRPAHLAPTALLAYAAAAPLLVRRRGRGAALPLLAYAGVVGAGAVQVAWRLREPSALPAAAGTIALVHANYGVGVPWGVLEGRRALAAPEALSWEGPAPAPVTTDAG
jgi:GT2 family glycosyltransferase